MRIYNIYLLRTQNTIHKIRRVIRLNIGFSESAVGGFNGTANFRRSANSPCHRSSSRLRLMHLRYRPLYSPFSSLSGILGDCPVVRPPQSGTVREKVLQDGTLQVVYSCEPGYKLKGHKLATCIADGWDHPVPKCVPSKCRRNI